MELYTGHVPVEVLVLVLDCHDKRELYPEDISRKVNDLKNLCYFKLLKKLGKSGLAIGKKTSGKTW